MKTLTKQKAFNQQVLTIYIVLYFKNLRIAGTYQIKVLFKQKCDISANEGLRGCDIEKNLKTSNKLSNSKMRHKKILRTI